MSKNSSPNQQGNRLPQSLPETLSSPPKALAPETLLCIWRDVDRYFQPHGQVPSAPWKSRLMARVSCGRRGRSDAGASAVHRTVTRDPATLQRVSRSDQSLVPSGLIETVNECIQLIAGRRFEFRTARKVLALSCSHDDGSSPTYPPATHRRPTLATGGSKKDYAPAVRVCLTAGWPTMAGTQGNSLDVRPRGNCWSRVEGSLGKWAK